jgi:RHS repeat-associated protein
VLLVSVLGAVAAWYVALLVGSPSQAADSPAAPVVAHAATPAGEIVGARTAQSKTFARSDGTRVTRVYPEPVNFRDGDGWKAIDDTLVDAGVGYVHRTANDGDALIPRSLADPFTVSNDGAWVTFAVVGGTGQATVAGDTATFPDVEDGVDAAYRAINDGLKETLTLASAGASRSFSYTLTTSDGLTPRLSDDGAIRFADAAGRAHFVIPAPMAWDANGSVSHRADLALARADGGGWRVTLSVDAGWLQDPARAFPVTVDPNVQWLTGGEMRYSGAQRDCTLASGSGASTSYCSDPTLTAGSDSSHTYNSLLYFNTQSAIPQDAEVFDATLRLHTGGTGTVAASNLRARPVSADWTNAATWNTRDGSTAWATAGGDVSATAGDASNAVSVAALNSWYAWTIPAGVVQGWVDGSRRDYGLQLSAGAGSPTQSYSFESTEGDPYKWPAIDIYWEEDQGAKGFYTLDSQQLSDRSQLSVNVANGDLTYSATDATLPGTAGLGLSSTRVWDSADNYTSATYGLGWSDSNHLQLVHTDADGSVYIADQTGAHYRFAPSGTGTYTSPPGINATLCKIGVATGCARDGVNAGITYKLTYNKSGLKVYLWDASGVVGTIKDKNNNTVNFDWQSTYQQANGTQSRHLRWNLDGSGYATSLTDGTRTTTYTRGGADPDFLASVTDQDSRTTRYEYNSGGYLSKITDPLGNVTTIDWQSVPDFGSWRATKVVRVLDPAHPTDPTRNPTTTYSYDPANHTTVVTDPVGNATTSVPHDGETTYTYDVSLQVSKVVDATGRETDTRYTPNGDIETFGDGTGTQNARLSTLTYANSGTNPTNNMTGGFTGTSGSPLEQFRVGYCGDPSEAACGSDPLQTYRPSRYTGSNGQFQTFGYDTSGNLTNVADGDSSRPAQNQATLSYDPSGSDTVARDGTLRSATDGNGNRTTFGYDTLRELTSINPPAAGTNDVVGTQLGSTTMTYDSFGRLATLTDGRGQVHTFSYDSMDRMTKDLLGSGDYIRYTYDADGNLTQRDERRGGTTTTSTYGFDALNRVSSESFPSGQSNTYAYTLNSQLYTLTTTGGTTTYGYDAIDRVTSITDASSAVVRYGYDDGTTGGTPRTITTTMPGGATTTTSLNQSGRPTSITTKSSGGTVIQNRSYGYGWTDASGARVGAQVSSMSDNAGNTTSYRYDQTGQLADAKKVNGSTTDELTWTFDRASNRTSKTRRLTGSADAVTSYKYNNNNQLCWTVPGTSANACNSAPAGGAGFTYDADGNQLTGGPGGAFTYDAYNRTTAMGSTSLGYLSPTQNELTTFGSTSMQYTALGLSAEINGTTKTYIIRDPSGNAVAQRRVSGTTLQGTDYYVPDNLGSTTALLTSGSVARSWTYDPDGTPASSGSGASTDLLFAGGQSLSNGLTHFGARYYNPAIGRWTQPDPLQQISDLTQANRYIYAGGDPVDGADPTGLCVDPSGFLCDTGNAIKKSPIGKGVDALTSEARDFGDTEAEFWGAAWKDVSNGTDEQYKTLGRASCLIFGSKWDAGPACDSGDAWNHYR